MLWLALLLLTACGQDQSGLTVTGSTSVAPFAEHLAEMYQRAHVGTAINIQSLGSGAGIQAAIDGVAEIGMSSRQLKPEEAAKLDELVIARDALAVIVHPDNPVSQLSLAQVQDIFSGKIRTWKAFGGPDEPINLVIREAGSGTFSAFDELVMKGKQVTTSALRQGSNGAIRQVVAEDPNAIGYISLGIVDSSVKPLTIDNVAPSVAHVEAGSYKFVRPFLFIWQKNHTFSPLAEQYVKFVMSDEGQQELQKLGLVKGAASR
ncbi:MAG TPA: phosphate ABC transporter substrate-binding protein [Kouleothrix sp.]|nr:phosphate ABC transporter substrate-binding protein [Kouleothrix sp.]HRC74060.1 phosphate ABC transporter substrate-binding protein [Kouleothrix sp.]